MAFSQNFQHHYYARRAISTNDELSSISDETVMKRFKKTS
jgi:lipase chaperone LimK